MEPISAIVLSIALGAAAEAGKATVAEVVKDAHAKVKHLLATRFSSVPVDIVEKAPESGPRRAVLSAELTALNADQDTELVAAAKKLIEAVKEYAPSAAGMVGVSLEDVEAANLRLSNISSTGTGVTVKKGKFSGDIVITDVKAGGSGEYPKKS
jgi:hypothetical protein